MKAVSVSTATAAGRTLPIFRRGYDISESGNFFDRDRSIFSFFIREPSVVGFIPSASAAPPGPLTRHLVRSSTLWMWRLSTSSRVVPPAPKAVGTAGRLM